MRAAILLLSVMSGVMWGSAGVFVRVLSEWGMDSVTIVFTRVSIATLMMLVLILILDKGMLRFDRGDAWIFLLCAVSMLGLNAFYTVSVDNLSLSMAAVLLSLSPAFMLVMARLIFGERITSRKLVCMMTSIAGCIMVSGVLESGGSISPYGVFSGLVAAFFYALYGIISKRGAAEGYSTYTILFYCTLISTIVLVPFVNLETMARFASEDMGHLGFLILHAAFASFLPYMLYTISITRGEVGTSSILAACGEPVAATFFGLMFFSEALSPLMILGMAVAVASMAVMCTPSKEDMNRRRLAMSEED